MFEPFLTEDFLGKDGHHHLNRGEVLKEEIVWTPDCGGGGGDILHSKSRCPKDLLQHFREVIQSFIFELSEI